jgi:hypothetical protein
MMFIALLIIAALALSGTAGFFSVYGLAMIYSASAISVTIMGASLEFAKLVAASFLHRYWNKISFALKAYLLLAVGVLMFITSIGIFGYLTAAYQQENIPVAEVAQKITADKAEVERLTTRKAQIDSQVEKIPNNMVNARQKLMKTFDTEYKTLGPNIDRLNKEIGDLQSHQLTVEAKVGPIMYVAKVLNQDPNNSIAYLTILLIFVFDPLAVSFTLAINTALDERKRLKEEAKAKDVTPNDSSDIGKFLANVTKKASEDIAPSNDDIEVEASYVEPQLFIVPEVTEVEEEPVHLELEPIEAKEAKEEVEHKHPYLKYLENATLEELEAPAIRAVENAIKHDPIDDGDTTEWLYEPEDVEEFKPLNIQPLPADDIEEEVREFQATPEPTSARQDVIDRIKREIAEEASHIINGSH